MVHYSVGGEPKILAKYKTAIQWPFMVKKTKQRVLRFNLIKADHFISCLHNENVLLI